MTQTLPPKKEVGLVLLERSNVDVYLDPRAKGVVVPPQFRKEPRLILKIGLNMPVPILDLRLDDDSMSCTLSFNRSPFYCVVPWSSVFAMVGDDGRGMVWPDDVPQELAVKGGESGDGPRAVDGGSRPARPRAVDSSAASSSSSATSPSRRSEGGRRSSKLAEDVPSEGRPSKVVAGGKRKKKKDEERARPVLVSVPSGDRFEHDSSSAPRADAGASGSPASPEASGTESPHQTRQSPEQRRSQPSASPREGFSAVPSARPRSPVPPQRRPPTGGPARPKRELPPYLRVVK